MAIQYRTRSVQCGPIAVPGTSLDPRCLSLVEYRIPCLEAAHYSRVCGVNCQVIGDLEGPRGLSHIGNAGSNVLLIVISGLSMKSE